MGCAVTRRGSEDVSGSGLPAHFTIYDLPFLRWAARRQLRADSLSTWISPRSAGGDALARLYDFVVFPLHHEYVTGSATLVHRRFRGAGGDLAWLSANNCSDARSLLFAHGEER